MTKRHFCFLFLFMLAFSFRAYGWWSAVVFRESTHHKLTSKAIEQLNETEYPDIYKFKDKICNWTSGPSDDENAHGKKYDSAAGKYNGGPYQRWWDNPPNSEFKNDGVLVRYKLRNFVNGDYSAYYYLAMMCHLIADQAVPAHAANILHGFPSAILNPDDLEKQSYNENPQQGDTIRKPGILHYYYFEDTTVAPKIIYGSIDDTQSQLPDWKSKDGIRYWLENDGEKYKGKAFDSSWGKYGGDSAKDIYDEEKDSQDIIQTQFLQSVAYTAGFLRTVSKKLPPLVSNLKLANNTITNTNSTVISFLVEENRTEYTKVKITVDGKPVKDSDKRVWDGETERWLGLSLPEEPLLPRQFSFKVNWDGLLADETYPTDGQHELVVQAQDTDGNWSDSCGVSFVIDRNPSLPITNLTTQSGDKQITLRWQNPPNSDYEKTEIVLKEGRLVYQGSGTTYVDANLLNGREYFYIAYAKDSAGNYSEGIMATGIPSRDRRVIEAINKLRSGDMDLMREGSIGLVRLGELSVEALIEIIKDSNEDKIIRIGAMSCLGRIGELNSGTTGKKVSAIVYVSENESDEDLRMAVAMVLGYFDTAESRNKLSELLRDGNEIVRISAAGALGMLKDESGYDVAVKAAESDDIFTRSRGIMALGYIGKEEGREIMMLGCPDLRLAEAISVALNQLNLTQSRAVARTRGGEIEDRTARINGLKEGLNDSRVVVREWALKGLILDLDRGNEEVKTIMIEIARNENHIASRSVRKELETRGIEW